MCAVVANIVNILVHPDRNSPICFIENRCAKIEETRLLQLTMDPNLAANFFYGSEEYEQTIKALIDQDSFAIIIQPVGKIFQQGAEANDFNDPNRG